MGLQIINGDCLEVLKTLPDESVNCCVTSPPYWGLRDYGVEGQLGLERTPKEYVSKMVDVFREVRRLLRDDGTLWLNLGDSYAGGGVRPAENNIHKSEYINGAKRRDTIVPDGLKPKDLVGIPWMVAFALRADGWYLRQDIIWHKPNPMPESVTDRCTKAHEYIFLMSKSQRYFYDANAICEVASTSGETRKFNTAKKIGRLVNGGIGSGNESPDADPWKIPNNRNRRSVWTVATAPFPGAHFATFPPKLILPCILAGCPEKVCAECGAPWERVVEKLSTGKKQTTGTSWDVGEGSHGSFHKNKRESKPKENEVMITKTIGFKPTCTCNADTRSGVVLDPFGGSGTVGMVAENNGRNSILIELNPKYVEMAKRRTAQKGIFNYC